MPEYTTLKEARALFEADRFAAENGVTIDEVGRQSAVCSFVVTPRHVNADGFVMGGAVFTLADFTVAVAANSTHWPTVTQQVSISFLSTARSSRVIARARCLRDSPTSCVSHVDVTDDLGRDVATALVTSYKVPPRT